MTRPTLLRRAAAATIGVDRRPSRDRALPPARSLTLPRRAAAAVIGVRTYRLSARATEAAPAPETGRAEARRGDTERAGVGSTSAPALLEPLGPPEKPRPGERPRRGLVLAAAAAVMAIAFGAYAYHHEDTAVKTEPAAGPLDMYLGTWRATLRNDLGKHTRRLVIRPGGVADTVMTLTADGPLGQGRTYHCVFTAKLESATFSSLRLSESTVASGKPPSSCATGTASTLILLSENTLRRVNEGNKDRLTYTRTSNAWDPPRTGPPLPHGFTRTPD